MITSLIIVCTYRRPGEVGELAELLARIRGDRGVLVVDASPDDATEAVCRAFGFVDHLRSERASTAFQRNRGIEHARARGVDVVHFVDDDSRPAPAYFDALEEMLETTDAAGVGGVVTNTAPVRWPRLMRLFLLDAPRHGVVLTSGWATMCRLPGSGGDVEWLPGNAMSYRLAELGGRSFDERLHGYSWGEDLDFSYRLGRDRRLCICPTALTRHEKSLANRASPRHGARDRVPIHHRWVVENRHRGLRRRAFWWAVAGEALLRGAAGVVTGGQVRTKQWGTARGIVDGALDVLRGRAPR